MYSILLETPATAAEKIFVSNSVHQASPAEIKITWVPYNLTSNLNAGVQISLWGYRETKTTPEFEYITTLEVDTIYRISFHNRFEKKLVIKKL